MRLRLGLRTFMHVRKKRTSKNKKKYHSQTNWPYSKSNRSQKKTLNLCTQQTNLYDLLWDSVVVAFATCRHVFAWDLAAFQPVYFVSNDSVIRELWNYSNRSATVSTVIRIINSFQLPLTTNILFFLFFTFFLWVLILVVIFHLLFQNWEFKYA